MNTPRDYNQPPWPQRPNPGPDPRRAPGYPPQQPANPWSQQPTQWAQTPPQPVQQPGRWAPPPAQYGHPVPPPTPTLPKKKSSGSKPFIIGGAIVAALIVVVVIALLASGAVDGDAKKIAVADVQTQVQQVLVDRVTGYSSGDIKDVKCNSGQDPTVKKGESFTCNVSVRGKPHQLKVTFKDADGTYEVGLPELDGGK